MANIQAQRGTKDVYGSDIDKFRFIEDCAREVFEKFNFEEIKTPIFEATELFSRGIGDSTDIVNKEMYTFFAPNNNENSLTLRPENTAGVCRAFIEHNLQRQSPPQKFWYFGPMFRYERPQHGRQRQFHQVGVEMFNSSCALSDAQVILAACTLLQKLGLNDLSVEINSLGCPTCRAEYKNSIKKVLEKHLDRLCDDCKMRYVKNPLRMLDCKCDECQKIFALKECQEVILKDYICDDCATHFEELKHYLDTVNVKYSVNKLLVRGLDYYSRTVFEIKSEKLGSQSAVAGGGRYDGLIKMLGGEDTPAIGFAMGVERLCELIVDVEPKKLDYYIISNDKTATFKLAKNLIDKGFSVDYDTNNRKFVKQLEKASKVAKYGIILGEDEIKGDYLTVKNFETGEQARQTGLQ